MQSRRKVISVQIKTVVLLAAKSFPPLNIVCRWAWIFLLLALHPDLGNVSSGAGQFDPGRRNPLQTQCPLEVLDRCPPHCDHWTAPRVHCLRAAKNVHRVSAYPGQLPVDRHVHSGRLQMCPANGAAQVQRRALVVQREPLNSVNLIHFINLSMIDTFWHRCRN